MDRTPVVGHFHITAKGREAALMKQNINLSFLTRNIEYPIHKFSDWLMTRVAQQVIVVGKDLADELVDFYNVDRKKIHLIESGVDTNRFVSKGDKVEFGFSPDSIVVLNIGRLSKRKNIDILVESFVHLPHEYKLVLCGEWEKHTKEKADNIIRENKLENRIKYIGKVSYFEIDKYYRSAEIFALPSSYEGLPKVVLEALSSGCKVLASGFRIDHTMPNLNFVEEFNPEAIAQKIIEIHNKESKYIETKSVIDAFYSWDIKSDQIAEIYKNIY